MGLEGLTTYKYKLYGNGHTVAEYVKGEKKFKHRALDLANPFPPERAKASRTVKARP